MTRPRFKLVKETFVKPSSKEHTEDEAALNGFDALIGHMNVSRSNPEQRLLESNTNLLCVYANFLPCIFVATDLPNADVRRHAWPRRQVRLVYYFEALLPVEALKASLAEALVSFPLFSGRSKQSGRRSSVLLNGAGALVREQRVTFYGHDGTLDSPALRPYLDGFAGPERRMAGHGSHMLTVTFTEIGHAEGLRCAPPQACKAAQEAAMAEDWSGRRNIKYALGVWYVARLIGREEEKGGGREERVLGCRCVGRNRRGENGRETVVTGRGVCGNTLPARRPYPRISSDGRHSHAASSLFVLQRVARCGGRVVDREFPAQLGHGLVWGHAPSLGTL